MRFDRDEVLARTDLGELADELLGPGPGRGRSATWPCPDPGHGAQTGKSPPVSLFRPNAGQERWRCHACGAGGTAADLVMVTQGVGFGEAMALLAARAGAWERDDPPPRPRPAMEHRPHAPPAAPSPEIEAHVRACEAYLWSPAGGPMRRWLGRRGLGDEVLRANRVGADPGPRLLPRSPGLPRSGPAVILPVLDRDGVAVYLQARYLHPPGGRKYDNPAAALAGPSPRLAEVRLDRAPGEPNTMVVCEGLPDALIAAQAGYRATAVLGAGLPDQRVAQMLSDRFGAERLVIAFDADERGRAGSAKLVELLRIAGAGRVAVADVPAAWGDLNAWQLAMGDAFVPELAAAVERATPVLAGPPISPGLGEQLEAIHYRHLLVDDPVLASRNLARVRRVIAGWERSGVSIERPAGSARLSPLEHDLDALAYRHLMGDDRSRSQANLAAVKAAVVEWSSSLGLNRSPGERDLASVPARPEPAAAALVTDRGLGIDL